MKPVKSIVHGGMMVVMFANQAAMAQQGVTIQDGNDFSLGAVGQSACTGVVATCTVVQLGKAQLSAMLAPVPAQAATVSIGGTGQLVNTGNATALLHVCGTYTTLSLSVATTLQIIGASSGKTIFVCDYDISMNTATNVAFNIGTGTNCGSANAQLGQTWYGGTNWGKIAANAIYRGLNSGAVGSSALCVKSTVTSTLDVGVYYDQY